ncbi:MAG: GntR family transcriptional regulator [Anaerolineae bacterium]|nr:GntR family transcriptional regulator [Anaerolineae bacterium]
MVETSRQRLRLQTTRLGSLSDQVYEHLRVAIVCADLQPGERLVELDIAAKMGTSQGTVREALQRLERDGLVERRKRSATHVTFLSTDEMYELFSIRCTIEGFACRRTATNITMAQCAELDDLMQKMSLAGNQDDIFLLAEHDMQFHRRLVEWSGSTGLLRLWAPLSNQIERFVVESHPMHYLDFVEVAMRHQPIVDALRNHNAEAAASAIQEHIMLIWPHIYPE